MTENQNPPVVILYLFCEKSPEESDPAFAAMMERLESRDITVRICKMDDPLPIESFREPRVYFSVGSSWDIFPALTYLPYFASSRWLHYTKFENIIPDYVFNCWLSSTDPLTANITIPPTQFSSKEPLISIFTGAYRSGDKIKKPYESLLRQTYQNWEWVIVDDSGDDDKTYNEVILPLKDPRIRKFRQEKRSGYIGAVKRSAAGLCTGEILMELDHDDDLSPDCLEKIVAGFKRHPECGFAYGDSAEVYAENNGPSWYGWDFGYGFGSYWRQYVPLLKRWQNVQKTADLNWQTIRHLVGLANHPRAWTRACYFLVGGHLSELSVADDYHLMVRTFLCTKFLRIPHMLYIQYRNAGGDNQTFKRNASIQILCQEIEKYYKKRINRRALELGLPCLDNIPYSRIWACGPDDVRWIKGNLVDKDPAKISYLFPIPHGCEDSVKTTLFKTIGQCISKGWKDCEVVVVGQVPAEIEMFASTNSFGGIRWWPMDSETTATTAGCGIQDCLRFAKLASSGSKYHVIFPPEHEAMRDIHLASARIGLKEDTKKEIEEDIQENTQEGTEEVTEEGTEENTQEGTEEVTEENTEENTKEEISVSL